MLTHLFVSNYALIDLLELDLSTGLTTITGETGAGKSILLGALRLVLGERADLGSIKDNTQKCIIEATFDISNLSLKSYFDKNELDYDDETIFRREILPSGKSRAFVNDVPTKLNILNELSTKLIDIHSQFETANLLTTEFQFQWVDSVAGIGNTADKYSEEYKLYLNTISHKKELEIKKVEFNKELGYNQFLLQEIIDAKILDHDLEELEKEQKILENAEDTVLSLADASQILEADGHGILSLLMNLQSKAKYFSEFLPNSDLKVRIDALAIETNDISTEIQTYLEEIEADPKRLQEVQSNLNQLNTLLQKHQVATLNELNDIKLNLEQKVNKSFSIDEEINELSIEIQKLKDRLYEMAKKIRDKRLSVIPKIEKSVMQTLKELGMPDAIIKLDLNQENNLNSNGVDSIQLLFTANNGMKLKTIDKSASGGERSRLMLAIKESVSKNRELPTLILDEIDTGVSGKVAGQIGTVMSRMGQHMQVIAITHLPQVAARGNNHLKVSKFKKGTTTSTSVHKLNYDERVKELAQIMSGEIITKAAEIQAEELLKLSNN